MHQMILLFELHANCTHISLHILVRHSDREVRKFALMSLVSCLRA